MWYVGSTLHHVYVRFDLGVQGRRRDRPTAALTNCELALPTADSTGRCNTFAELLSGRVEAKRFAWPPVQLSGNGIELKL